VLSHPTLWLSVEELHVGFQRALADFDMWSESHEFAERWADIYATFIGAVTDASQARAFQSLKFVPQNIGVATHNAP
jgi:hypothetical protein